MTRKRTGTKIIQGAAIITAVEVIYVTMVLPFTRVDSVVYYQIVEIVKILIPVVGVGYLGNEGRKTVENRGGTETDG